MGLLDQFLDKQIEKRLSGFVDKAAAQASQTVVAHVDQSLEKASNPYSPLPSPGLKRYEFSPNNVNGNMQSRKKPGANITFETMRRFSVSHEVTRACINYRKRQLSGLDWDIVSADDDAKTLNKARAEEVKQFFKLVGGRGNGYRRFLDKVTEDLMVLDALALEKQTSRGGGLLTLLPVDAATIRVKVDDTGAIPEPPDVAYVQIINGTVTAELTADEMIYSYMNPRNDSPYGLSALESLMITVTSQLKAAMYNLAYLTDGNIPEGFYTMPEGWQPQQIKDFQEYFDALMSGDETMTRRLKFMPHGEYMPTTKPSDMAFQEFNDWLMKLTCALFEVSPMAIGFMPKTGLGGKGFSDGQSQVDERKGLVPLAAFIEEMFTDLIQKDMGFTDLKFQYTSLLERDEKAVAELNEILVRSGQRTVNELRTDDGLAPIDGLDKPFFAGQLTFLDQESQDAKQVAEAAVSSQLSGQTTEQTPVGSAKQDDKPAEGKAQATEGLNKRDPAERHVELVSELRTFRKYVLGRLKANKTIRAFESHILPESTVNELNERVQKAADTDEVRSIFSEYMSDYQINFLADVDRLRKQVAEVL